MRVLIDTNVFVSYVLSSTSSGTIPTLVDLTLSGRFTLLLPQELLIEMLDVLTTRPYFTIATLGPG